MATPEYRFGKQIIELTQATKEQEETFAALAAETWGMEVASCRLGIPMESLSEMVESHRRRTEAPRTLFSEYMIDPSPVTSREKINSLLEEVVEAIQRLNFLDNTRDSMV